MAEIAFYAPMKAPTHPVPSGDRAMARALMAALGDVELVSELRLRDGRGDRAAQIVLEKAAEAEVKRLVARGGWHVWVTYHNYYKAPDLIGPAVCRALNIPYVLIEATRAKKRLGGHWDRFAQAAEVACDQADVIFYLTERDRVALDPHRPAYQRLEHLPPFLLRESPMPERSPPDAPAIFAVAMMRPGDKLASYQLLSEMLSRLTTPDWTLSIAGDGTERATVEALFAPFGPRIRFLGRLDAEAVAQQMAQARVMVWPGVNEAFGLVYLEAQVAGLPVVAQDRPGVREVLPGTALVPMNDAQGMARATDQLLTDNTAWRTASEQGRQQMIAHHLLPAAQERLHTVLSKLKKERR